MIHIGAAPHDASGSGPRSRGGRWAVVTVAVLLLCGYGATVALAKKHKPRPRPISASAAFVLPSARRCVSARTLTIQVRSLRHVQWASATVKVNGRRFKVIKRSQLRAPVKLTGLPKIEFVLSVTARAGDGRSVTATRTYRPCASKGITPTPTPTPTPTVSPTPGSYSGNGIVFYVSADSTKVQDVSVSFANMSCSPGGSFQDSTFNIPSIAVKPDGSFSATGSQDGVHSNAAAHFTYTFAGQFHGAATASGTWREDVTYNNGSATSCTSNSVSWTLSRDAQGSQTASPPPAGSYSGNGIVFYVSPDSSHVQDVSVSFANIACSPGTSFQDSTFAIPSITIAPDGSFSGTATQSALHAGFPAQFTYTFAGHFHGTSSSGVQRAAGQWREDITYTNGGTFTCSSNTFGWALTRDNQGAQSAAAPPAGTYTGSSFTFHVSPDGTQIQNVAGSFLNIACTPGGSFQDSTFNIAAITINADGSFQGSSTQSGTHASSPAMFTYTFVGHFHGTSSSGVERAAGQYREDVTYNNGTQFSCTSDTLPFTMTRTGP